MLGGYLWDFTRSALSLIGAAGLAWLLLRVLGKRGADTKDGPLRVLQRVSLDARSRLYLVRLGERTLLLGSSDSAAPTLLAELPLAELPCNQAQAAAPAAGPGAALATRDAPQPLAGPTGGKPT